MKFNNINNKTALNKINILRRYHLTNSPNNI